MIYRGVVITGTDTGVGKTVVGCALVSLFRERGLTVGVLKPVETGCAGEGLAPRDALMLCRAAGIELEKPGALTGGAVRLEDVVPWRFGPALAPEEAARQSGVEISVDRIYQALDRWTERADVVVVETAGGLMAPLNARFTFADLLQGFELPVMVVAENRLGVINQVLLTLSALRARELTTVAVILTQLQPEADLSAGSNAELIRGHGKVKVWEVPYGGSGPEEARVLAATAALRPHFEELQKDLEAAWRKAVFRYLNRK